MTKVLIFLFIYAFHVSAQTQGAMDAITMFESATITVENVSRSPSSTCLDCNKDASEDNYFYSDDPASVGYDSGVSGPGINSHWLQYYFQDGSGKRPAGLEFTMEGPNTLAPSPLDPTQKIQRQWKFVSKKGSRRETYIQITDDAGSGYLSQLMETVVVMIPRKVRPHMEEVGKELHLTLTTGEKVIFDKATHLIKAGVLQEGPIDRNPNRHARKFAPLTYKGEGISIRVDKRGEDPRLNTGMAIVTQKGKKCEVPVKDLWHNPSIDFKFSDDEKLLQFLNTKCQGKFSL